MPSADSTTQSQNYTSSPSSSASKSVSISLGTSKFKKPSTVSVTSTILTKKRPHSSLQDLDDSDPETSLNQSPQLVSAFDATAGGAISAEGVQKEKAPLVIPGLKNRDWREESRRKRGKNLLPAEVQAQRAGQHPGFNGAVERNEVSQQSGLSFVPKDAEDDVAMKDAEEAPAAEEVKEQTADEEALEALVSGGGKKSTLVVPAEDFGTDGMNSRTDLNEDDSFRTDVASRPDSATLDDYARIPVEEFGLAMLRGMSGWKEGEFVGKRKDQISKSRVVERRPALLGIGAKEVPGGVGDELGAWGKATKGKRTVDKTYNPVLLKNSRTGELLTEEELQAKKEQQKMVEEDWRERRDRNLAIDEERKSERRRKERERMYEDGRDGSSRRERSRSGESRHSASRRDRSRSPSRRRDSSRRERSRSAERRRHSRRRDDDRYDDHDRRKADRYDKERSKSSKHSHRSRDGLDDTSRRRHEVY